MMIPPTWSIPAAIQQRLGTRTVGRLRAIVEQGHLLLVLHNPPGPDQRQREGVLFWRDPNGDWQFNRGGPGPGGLKRHVQSYLELEAKLTAEYEAAADLDALFELLEQVTPLSRSARNMHQAIQTARETIGNDPVLIEVRDLAYEAERNLELLYQDLRNAIQYRMAHQAEHQARLARQALRASHRLNILAALFFPVMAVSSLLGMNLAHGLNPNNVLLFWIIAGAGLGLGLAIMAWVLAPSNRDTHAPDKR